MEHHDGELQRLFDDARTHEERRAPSFASIVAPRRATARPARLRFAMTGALIVVAAIAAWRLAAPDDAQLDIAFTPGEMHVPTDYLLDMMTFPRAGEIPRLGAEDWYPLPLAGDATPDTRRTP